VTAWILKLSPLLVRQKAGKAGRLIVYLLTWLIFSVARAAERQAPSPPQSAIVAQTSVLLEITLESKRNGKIETMAAGHVFEPGDIVRLRLQSHYAGFLYVLDHGTSGRLSTVFPSTDTGSDNRLKPDQSYLVPAVEEGWFEVQGPAGFDVLYFLLSPTELAKPAGGSFLMPGPVSSLRPRCNDKVFRARGECTDDSAGLSAVPANQPLPAQIAPLAGSASRDIIFTKQSGATVGVEGGTTAPIIYTFRLAHH
jgi:Domain of unknown function (DUF4384)